MAIRNPSRSAISKIVTVLIIVVIVGSAGASAFLVTNDKFATQTSGTTNISTTNSTTASLCTNPTYSITPESKGFNGFVGGLAYDPIDNRIFLPGENNSMQNSVYVISGQDESSVIRQINLGRQIFDAVFDPSNDNIYMTDYASNSVYVINGASYALEKNVSVGAGPYGIAYDPSTNQIYVANSLSNSVSVIDGTTNVVNTTIELTEGPLQFAYDSQSKSMYVTTGSSIYLLAPHGLNASSLPSSRFSEIAYDPANGEIYLASYGIGQLLAMNPSTWDYVANISLPYATTAIGYDQSTSQILAGSNATRGQLYVIDSSTNRLVSTYTNNSIVPVKFEYDSQTGQLLLSSSIDQLFTISSSCESITSTTTSSSCATSPDGFSEPPLMNVFYSGGGPNDLTFGAANGTVYFADQNSGSLYETNTTGFEIANYTVGFLPQRVIYIPSLDSLYVSTARSIVAINAFNGSTYQNISASLPYSMVYVPVSNELYAGLLSNKTLVIDVSSGQVVKTIDNTFVPFSLVYDPTDNLIYEENYTSTLVINPATNQIVSTIPLVRGPMLYDPLNDRIYIADSNGTIFVIDPQTNSETGNFYATPDITEMTWDSRNNDMYFISGYPGYLGEFSVSTDSVGAMLQTSGLLTSIEYNPVDNFLFATSFQNSKAYVYTPFDNSTSSSVTCTTTTPSANFTGFFVTVIYNGNWSGNYMLSYSKIDNLTVANFSGYEYRNQSVPVSLDLFNTGACVSALVQKGDSSDNAIHLIIQTSDFAMSTENETALPNGFVSAKLCS